MCIEPRTWSYKSLKPIHWNHWEMAEICRNCLIWSTMKRSKLWTNWDLTRFERISFGWGCRLGALPIGQHKPRSLQHLRLTIMAVMYSTMDEAQMKSMASDSRTPPMDPMVGHHVPKEKPHPMFLPFHCSSLHGWSLHCVSAAFNGSSVSPWRPEVLGDGSVAKGESQVGLVDVDSFYDVLWQTFHDISSMCHPEEMARWSNLTHFWDRW